MYETVKISQRHYDEALKLVNRSRVALGRKPVKRLRKGVRGDMTCCVIAKSINIDGVNVNPINDYAIKEYGSPIIVSWDDGSRDVIAKGGVLARQFAQAFDHNEIPELVLS